MPTFAAQNKANLCKIAPPKALPCRPTKWGRCRVATEGAGKALEGAIRDSTIILMNRVTLQKRDDMGAGADALRGKRGVGRSFGNAGVHRIRNRFGVRAVCRNVGERFGLIFRFGASGENPEIRYRRRARAGSAPFKRRAGRHALLIGP